jgi:hypothetical protein
MSILPFLLCSIPTDRPEPATSFHRPAMTSNPGAMSVFVSPDGHDEATGSRNHPFATLARALDAIAKRPTGQKVTVEVRGGTYYLPQTLTLNPAHSGTANSPVTIEAYRKENVVISGGQKLTLNWRPYKGPILQATVPADLETEELFVNGQRQILARYPNFDPNQRIFNGYAADAISKERVAKWADPAGGYFHAMHPAEWGDYTWRITGKKPDGEVALEGGWQNNRPAGPHPLHRFVENIFEELDAPGEWFLNRKTHVLYFYPPAGLDLSHATVEATRLRSLVQFKGSPSAPVRHINLKGFTFRHAARTFMDTREPLLRTDWAIYRGGALFYEGAEDCLLQNCFLDQLGGNAIFVNGYNRRLTFRSLQIARAGASGFNFVGNPEAARSALFNYDQTQPLDKVDLTPGPKSDQYPADCLVDDCLIYLTGRTEKQTAGVNIDLAQSITVRHCSIYDTPRAGINIGDGCWGGHIIEDCDIFDTVKETGDHGSFNSWGRDRFWNPDTRITDCWVGEHPEMPFLDAQKPNILRNNRWRCDHGWDIDLDDGSSNYEIYNNLCLNGGIKNREGYRRLVTNNVLVNNGFHPHVWYANSGDVFRNNIVWATYAPARMYPKPWPPGMDANFIQIPSYPTQAQPVPAASLQLLSGRDGASIEGDAQFVNPAKGDYRVKKGSPALRLGFKNFRMDRFGVTSPALRAIARRPLFPQPANQHISPDHHSSPAIVWLGATVKNIQGQEEMSAYGTPGETGILILKISPTSPLKLAHLNPNDVILSINNHPTPTTATLPTQTPQSGSFTLTFLRNQQTITVTVNDQVSRSTPLPSTAP